MKKMNGSQVRSIILALLLVVMLAQLCMPYFTYGDATSTFVPPSGGNEGILNATWVLSGSDASQDGYKEITIKSGKMTVKTTNIIRVDQVNADKAVDAIKGHFTAGAKAESATELTHNKMIELNKYMEEAYAVIEKNAKPDENGENADLTAAQTSQKKVVKAVDDAKANYDSAVAQFATVETALKDAREGAVETYKADASVLWIYEKTDAYTQALYDTYFDEYNKANYDRIKGDLVQAAYDKEYKNVLKAKKDEVYKEHQAELDAKTTTKSALDKTIDEAALKAERMDMAKIEASVEEKKINDEVDKQFNEYLKNMLGATRDGVIFDKIDAEKATANAGAAKAAAALKASEAANKEIEKLNKNADKPFTTAVKEYDKIVALAQKYDAEKVYGASGDIAVEANAPKALAFEEYDKTSTEKEMMETEGKAKYDEKKAKLTLTFANDDKYEIPFAASFGYNEVKHLSILGYVGFPYNVEDFTADMVYQLEGYYINDVVLLPILLLVVGIIGIIICIIYSKKMATGILPFIFGIMGVIGYLTSDFLKLGDYYTRHIICYAVVAVFAALHIFLSIRKGAKKA